MSKKPWVPVSIRIPEHDKKVRLKMKSHSLAGDIYDIGWRDRKTSKWILDDGSSPDTDKDLLVIAWQELEPGEYPMKVHDETASSSAA